MKPFLWVVAGCVFLGLCLFMVEFLLEPKPGKTTAPAGAEADKRGPVRPDRVGDEAPRASRDTPVPTAPAREPAVPGVDLTKTPRPPQSTLPRKSAPQTVGPVAERVAPEQTPGKSPDSAAPAGPSHTPTSPPASAAASLATADGAAPAASDAPPTGRVDASVPERAEPVPGAKPVEAQEVLVAQLPNVTGVGGGTITYEEKAFPILADKSVLDVQRYLGLTRLAVCRTCRGTGKVRDKAVIGRRKEGVMYRPIYNSWDKTCPDCRCEAVGCDDRCPRRPSASTHDSCERCCGAGAACQNLRFYPHCCGSCCPPDSKRRPCNQDCCSRHRSEPTCTNCRACAALRELRQAHAVPGACDYCRRDASCPSLRLGHGNLFHPRMAEQYLELVASLAHAKRSGQFQAVQNAASERLKSLFEQRVATHFGPFWDAERAHRPSGQPMVLVGEVTPMSGPPGPMRYAQMVEANTKAQAVLVCGPAGPVPAGRAVVGGLYVGTWAKDPAGSTPVPVILIVMATGP